MAEAERLDQLARIRSLPELARALYPEARLATALDLERRLVEEQVRELALLAPKIGGASGRLLEWLLVRFQMENLKVLARGLARGMSLAEIQPHLVPLPHDLALASEALASAGSIEAFAALVPDAVLKDGVLAAADLYKANPRPFFIESGLDQAYLGELLSRARAVPLADRADVVALVRQEVDTFHLTLVARGRFTYGLKAEELVRFHVRGAAITRERFLRMASAEDLGAAAVVAGPAVMGWAAGRGAAPPPSLDAVALEAMAWNRYWRLANRTFRHSHMGLGAVVAYTAIRRVELANLIRLSEGIRAGLPADVIRRRLTPRSDLVLGRAPAREGSRV